MQKIEVSKVKQGKVISLVGTLRKMGYNPYLKTKGRKTFLMFNSERRRK